MQCVASKVSSPGSGKTALLEDLLARLGRTHRGAALVGDLATENDAARLARSGARVRPITTEAARKNINAVRPGMEIVSVSSKTGEGMSTLVELLQARLTEPHGAVTT